jgi:hypothetical protein
MLIIFAPDLIALMIIYSIVSVVELDLEVVEVELQGSGKQVRGEVSIIF